MLILIALAVGAGVMSLVWWLRSRDIKVTWYEWLMGTIGLALLLSAVPNVPGFLAEDFPTAALVFGLVTGLPALILLAITWRLISRRQRATG